MDTKYSNVWGTFKKNGDCFQNGGRRASFKTEGFAPFGSLKTEQNSAGSSGVGNFAVGPFGSNTSFESRRTSLPAFELKRRNSKINHFELGNSSSGSSSSNNNTGSGPNSMLSLGTESKKYNWSTNPFSNADQNMMDTSSGSGGSSRTSSGHGSYSQLDWDGTVDGVFKEEIGKMSLGFQRGSCFGIN